MLSLTWFRGFKVCRLGRFNDEVVNAIIKSAGQQNKADSRTCINVYRAIEELRLKDVPSSIH